jgi:amino acid adenylation domain-containing protein
MAKSSSLVEILLERIRHSPHRLAYGFLVDGEREEDRLTYAELGRRACAVAALLQQRCAPGDRALLVQPPGLGFIAAFLGCLAARVVAVPVHPPRRHSGISRLCAIARDTRPAVLLSTPALLGRLRAGQAECPELAGAEVVATDGLDPALAERWVEPDVDPDALAFLQYTSGSTSEPRGVRVTHANLIHNERMIADAFGQSADSVILGWLPLFHDMGLIGNVLQPLYLGAPCWLMSPLAFLQRPARWLEALSRYRATTSGGPDFAYDLCVRKVGEAERSALDLSSWSLAFSGSEPVRAETLDRFAAAFAPCGFRRTAFYPCYGLAEATLFVTGGTRGTAPPVRTFAAAELAASRAMPVPAGAPGARPLVGCGRPWGGQRVVIADPQSGAECPPGRLGEIWIAGPSVADGYVGQPEGTEQTFRAHLADGSGPPFLRTGDLGFLDGGDLFVAGRLKDLIILRGRNLYPQDVERTAERAHPDLRLGGAAALSLETEEGERLAIVLEVERRAAAEVEVVAAAVRQAVAAEHEAQVQAVVLIRAGALPKTSSGKVQRRACREAWLAGDLAVVGESILGARAVAPAPDWREIFGLGESESRAYLATYLRDQAARILGAAADSNAPLTELHLDSLAAAELQNRIVVDLGVALDLAELLGGWTLKGLAAEILRRLERGSERTPAIVAQGPTTGEHPASRGQRALWVLQRRAPESAALGIAAAARVRGGVTPEAMGRAYARLAEHHPSLRTTFRALAGGPRQVVHEGLEPDWAVEDASGWTAAALAERLAGEAHRPFDLERGPLVRGRLFLCNEGDPVLLLAVHHAVTDLRSLALLLHDLGALVEAERRGAPAALTASPVRYTDWVRWQEELLAGPEGERLWAHWRDRLAGAPPHLDLPTDRPRPPLQGFHGLRRLRLVPPDLAADFRSLAREHGATLFAALLAADQALLHRYTGITDLLIGSPASGRTRPELADVAGYFVNMLVLRGDLGGNPAFTALLEQAKGTILGALAHQGYPFALLAERLALQRDPSRSPLFQVALVLHGAAEPGERSLGAFAVGYPGVPYAAGGLELESLACEQRGAQFDLTLTAAELPDGGLALALLADADLFEAATVERTLGHFEMLLRGAVETPEARLSELPLLAAAERQQIRHWEGGRGSWQAIVCLHRLFADQAARTPDAVAICTGADQRTYGQLERQANRLAHHLRALGVRPEVRVGLCLGRSPDMVIGILGIAKAGGAYVPLDPSYPAERLALLVDDAGLSLIVTRGDLAAALPPHGVRIVRLEQGWESIGTASAGPPVSDDEAAQAAYLIYTSGSTGRPKGVVVSHAAVVRLFLATRSWFGFGVEDVWTLFHSFTFDFSVWELWGALLHGGRLVLVPYEVSRSPRDFLLLLSEERVTVLCQTPAAFRQLVWADRSAGEPRDLANLRWVILGGEALDLPGLRPWFEQRGDERPRVVNMYGITETTVHVTFRPLTAADVAGGGSFLGEPIPDLHLLVLDCGGSPVPVGIPGEIQVGGAGLARGYHGMPDLTAERFVPDPTGEPGARLYRSGDLARRRPDGDLDYLGRIDHQVKVRGFRIELGEIEAALAAQPGVREVAVAVQEVEPARPAVTEADTANGAGAEGEARVGELRRFLKQAPAGSELGAEARLVAYLVADARTAPDMPALRKALQRRLPDYMVPAAFVLLDRLPLTPNGKLDRRALPAPGRARPDLESAYVAPRNRFEREMAALWSEVLGIERAGIDDNYFALGGDSIRSLRVQALAEERGLAVSFQDLFQFQTLRELSAAVGRDSRDSRDSEAEPVERLETTPFSLVPEEERRALPAGVIDAYPLARLQAGLVFHSQLHPESPVYRDIFVYRFRAPFDAGRLREAAQQLVDRHPILRTSFDLARPGEPLQRVHRRVPAPLCMVDLRDLPSARREAASEDRIREEKARPFDWSRPPLIRYAAHRLTDEQFDLVVTFHDSILDGWSTASMLTELLRRYVAMLRGLPEPVGTPAVTYRDFVALERATIQSSECRGYWERKLEGATAVDLPRVPERRLAAEGHRIGVVDVPVPQAVSDGLNSLARRAGVPLKHVLLSAHLWVMGRMGGRPDALTGLESNGRLAAAEGELTLGIHLNTLPFRQRLDGGTWLDLTRQTFDAEREMLPFRRFPYAEMQRLHGGRPLFETVFNYTHFHVFAELRDLPELEVLDSKGREQTHYTLKAEFNRDPFSDRIHLDLECNVTQLTGSQMHSLAGLYSRALAAMSTAPEARYETLDLLSEVERHQLLAEDEDTMAPSFVGVGIHELFERQADRTPHGVALRAEGEADLAYRELEWRANRLANHLLALRVAPETLVAVCLERSAAAVVAVLAVLKAGGAFLPLDPTSPAGRLAFVLEDSGARVLITREGLLGALPERRPTTVLIDRDAAVIDQGGSGRPRSAVHPEALAYVIYTSGSTGLPKGVAALHRGAVNRLRWMWERFPFAPGDVACHKTFLGFVDSIWEIFGPLLQGVPTVIIPDEVVRDQERLLEHLATARVTRIVLVPSLLRVLLDAAPDLGARLPCLRFWVSSGEALPADLAGRFLRRAPGAVLLNLYGSSEVAADVTFHRVRGGEGLGQAPIGRPISNTRIFLLEAGFRPVPPGVPGELLAGGEGLARGYLHRPDLTAERFVPDPCSGQRGARLYRTGDLACRLPDGGLEYLGRLDHQVKIRGMRVEPGEVEAALGAHPAVREAMAVPVERAPGDVRLVAYVATDRTDDPDLVRQLRRFLEPRLPAHMMPAAFVPLAAMPLNRSGKVDRAALPPPEEAPEPAADSVRPRTPVEEVLAGIWAEVLGLDRVGLHERFADLGGHSLLATQMVARMREALGLEVPLRLLFEAPTVAELAEAIGKLDGAARTVPPLVRRPRESPLPLSFAQQRLWFEDRLVPGNPAYNVHGAYLLQGELAVGALERSLGVIVERHEALRTSFADVPGGAVQVIAPAAPVPLPRVDLSTLPKAGRRGEAVRLAAEEARWRFHLARGPLLRAVLLRLAPRDHQFLLTLHHIVSDGWSQGIFLGELAAFYRASVTGETAGLPDLEVQYADFAQWQREWLQGEALGRQISYWKRQFAGGVPDLELPTDRPRPRTLTIRGARRPLSLGAPLAAELRALSRRQGSTLFMTLMAGFATLLHSYTGQERVAIGTDVAARDLPQTERLIGFFVNQLVLVVDLSRNPTFRRLLAGVREAAFGAYAHQDLPFERLVEVLNPPRLPNRTPLFQVKLVLQNAPSPSVEMAGLTLSPIAVDGGTAKFDLLVNLWETADGIAGSVEHRSDLFDGTTIDRMLARFAALLGRIAAEPDIELRALVAAVEEGERAERLAEQRGRRRMQAPRFRGVPPWVIAAGEERRGGELDGTAEGSDPRLAPAVGAAPKREGA